MDNVLLTRSFWEANHADRDGLLLDRVTDLLERGEDVGARDESGRTILHHAVKHQAGHEVVALLLHSGAEINVADKDNWTPLFYAVSSEASAEVVATLLDYGATINAGPNKAKTAVDLAVDFDARLEVLALLLPLVPAPELPGLDQSRHIPWYQSPLVPADALPVTPERREEANVAIRQYFSTPSGLQFMQASETFLKRIDPFHTEFIDVFMKALSLAPDGESKLHKEVLLPRTIAHEIKVGTNMEVLDSSSHDAKFALETAGVPIDSSTVTFVKRTSSTVNRSPFPKKPVFKAVLAKGAAAASSDGVRVLTKPSFVEETAKDTGDCVVGFEFPPPKEDAAAAAALCPNRGARLAESSTLRDLSGGLARRSLVELEEAMESAEELFANGHGKCLLHHSGFLESTAKPVIEELFYEATRAPLDDAAEKRDLVALKDALEHAADLSGSPFEEEFRRFVDITVMPLIEELEYAAARAPLEAAIKARDQRALEEAVKNAADLSGSRFAEPFRAFLEDTAKALLDLVTLENELRDRPSEVRLYVVSRAVFLKMWESGEGLVVFQDLRRRQHLKRLMVSKQAALAGVLRGQGDESSQVLAISYPWQGFGDPDSTGERIEGVVDFLSSHPEIEYLWWDFMCVPQNTNMLDWEGHPPAEPYPNTYRKNAFEKLYFQTMINRGGVNLVYLGAYVLSIANALYLHRFWTQFEYMLATRAVTKNGFESSYLRSFVYCIQSLKDSTVEQEHALQAKWTKLTVADAVRLLGMNDVTVTNMSDKLLLLAKLPNLEKEMIEIVMSMPAHLRVKIEDDLFEEQQKARLHSPKHHLSPQPTFTRQALHELSMGESVEDLKSQVENTAVTIAALKKRVADAQARATSTNEKLHAMNNMATKGAGGSDGKIHPL